VRTTSTGQEFYHTDALGSVLVLTDSSGVVQTTYRYDPFGNTTVTGTSTNVFQYTGRENDGTGLYYYRERYYSPKLQRFIGEDPIGFAGGDVNFYAYVGNNPVRYFDPFGLCPVCVAPLVPILTNAAVNAAVVLGGLITGAIIGDIVVDNVFERGGKENVKESDPDRIREKLEDTTLSKKERKKLEQKMIRHEKGEGDRNKRKRNNLIIPPVYLDDDSSDSDNDDTLGGRKN